MRWTLLVAAVIGLGSCGSGLPGSGPHACTLIGCADQFSAKVKDASGGLPSGMYALTVMADGATATCSFTLPLTTLPGGGTMGIDCSGGLQVLIVQDATCTTTSNEQVKTQTCTPIAGKYTEIITLMGKPTTVHVTQTVGGATVLDETVTPAYKTSRPNGPDCGPVCSQAGVDLVLTPA